RFKNAVFLATKDALNLETADDVFKYPEPVSKLAQRHSADMTLQDVALELGVPVPAVETLVDGKLQRSLGTLRHGRPIKRDFWESKLRDLSVFQDAAFEAGLSIGPLNVQ